MDNTSLDLTLYTMTALLGFFTLLSICRRGSFSSLRKREREEGPSFEPDSKRAKLDEARTSSSNPVAPELVQTPEAAPELVQTPEAALGEELEMVASPDFDALDDIIDLGNQSWVGCFSGCE